MGRLRAGQLGCCFSLPMTSLFTAVHFRRGHSRRPERLRSQFADLVPSADALTPDIRRQPEQLAPSITTWPEETSDWIWGDG